MKVILLGDSITQGIGSKAVNYQAELELLLGDESMVLNWAVTGSTIDCAVAVCARLIEERPDFVVLLYGNVDAQIRPCRTGKLFRYLPGRFGAVNGCMILPRPFYSHKWYLWLLQRLENALRSLFRHMFYHFDGTEQWVQPERYLQTLDAVCKRMHSAGIHPVICSTVYIDERLFPGRDVEYRKINALMLQYATENGYDFVYLYSALKQRVQQEGWSVCYNEDHFHPNAAGYHVFATQIVKALNRNHL